MTLKKRDARVLCTDVGIAQAYTMLLVNTGVLTRLETMVRLISTLFKVTQVRIQLLNPINPEHLYIPSTSPTLTFTNLINNHECWGPEMTQIVCDTRLHPYLPRLDSALKMQEIRFFIAHPLQNSMGQYVGNLYLGDSQPRVFNQHLKCCLEDVLLLLESELVLAQQGISDDLTGLVNRRTFLQVAEYVLCEHARWSQPATVLFMDLNDFKRINDDFGHAEGDRALKQFASLLLRGFRQSDICARFAGDEFVVLLPGTGQHSGDETLRRFRYCLRQFNEHSELPYNIDVAVGRAHYDGGTEYQLEALLGRADADMYVNKQQTKNAAINARSLKVP